MKSITSGEQHTVYYIVSLIIQQKFKQNADVFWKTKCTKCTL